MGEAGRFSSQPLFSVGVYTQDAKLVGKGIEIFINPIINGTYFISGIGSSESSAQILVCSALLGMKIILISLSLGCQKCFRTVLRI